VLPVFDIAHTPLTVVNSELPVPIQAVVTSINGYHVLNSVTLHWSNTDGAPYQSVAMTLQGGSTWKGFVPGQTSPEVVKYYLEAAGNDGIVTLPANAPAATFGYDVGTVTTQVFYDFAPVSAEGWTSAGTGNEWQHDTPRGKSTDPAAAFSGTRCWGSDLGLNGVDGMYEENTSNYLQSPTFNFSGKTNLRLRFHRWLGVLDGSQDQAT